MRGMMRLALLGVPGAQGVAGTLLQTLAITGTGSEETDYIIPLILHRGAQDGDWTGQDVYLGESVQPDFSDVYFEDENGTRLPLYIHSHGNYEALPDSSRLGEVNYIKADGTIVASNVPNATLGIAESDDNGETWAVLYPDSAVLVFVSPTTDTYFAHAGYKLLRSAGPDHTTWTEVIDMSAVSGHVQPQAMKEMNGVLIAGRYQASNDAVAWRSLDDGLTWEQIFQGDASLQHIHGVMIDPVAETVYLGVDATTSLWKSTNAADPLVPANEVTWSNIVPANSQDMVIGDGWKLFNVETPAILEEKGPITGIIRTADDDTFVSELQGGYSTRALFKMGGKIYATTVTQYSQEYAQILCRDTAGQWTTLWIAPHASNLGNAGPRYAMGEGTPTGASESQMLIGNTASHYPTFRFFSGGNHYQAVAYMRLPTLPAAGTTIKVYGGVKQQTALNSVFVEDVVQPDPLVFYKFDEGSGTSIVDASGNNKTATFVPGTGGWNAEGGHRIGSAVPFISLPGKSIHLEGDGYVEIDGSDTDPDFQFTSGFSVLFWYRSTGWRATQHIVVGKGSRQGAHWSIRTVSGGNLRFYVTPLVYVPGPTDLNDGEWHFVGCTVDASNNVRWCVNGRFSGPHQLSQAIQPNASPIRIGADSTGDYALPGDVDRLLIYPTVLTNDQMRQMYENRWFADNEPYLTWAQSATTFVDANGTTTEINAGNEESISNLLTEGPATIEGWIRPDSAGGSNRGTILYKYGWTLLYGNADGLLDVYAYGADTTRLSTTLLPDQRWHHFAITHNDSDGKLRLWIDGLLKAIGGPIVDYVGDLTRVLNIGYYPGKARYWDGGIGWVRVSDTVRYHYNFIPPLRDAPPVVDANTVRLFKMDEGEGTVITDYSANAQNATLANGTWDFA